MAQLHGFRCMYANAYRVISAERRRDQVCSEFEYSKVFMRIGELPQGAKHLVVQLGTIFAEITVLVLFIKIYRRPHCISTNGLP